MNDQEIRLLKQINEGKDVDYVLAFQRNSGEWCSVLWVHLFDVPIATTTGDFTIYLREVKLADFHLLDEWAARAKKII